MTTATDRTIARKEQLLRELGSDLAEMVRTGDLTEEEANQWLADKQDQWFGCEAVAAMARG
jgi:hypothetical protein